MCTVTYLPKSKTDYILTSSRDEQVLRKSLMPAEYRLGDHTVFFPKDPKSGGTWIAYGDQKVVCLLNGAFQKHLPSPPYKRSRGLVLLDYFNFDHLKAFVHATSFEQIEPFTLIVVEKHLLTEFRWDGAKTTLTSLDPQQAYIWSSSTLYTPEVIEKRKNWFLTWIQQQSVYDVSAIRQLHKMGGDGDLKNDFNMCRENGLQTISISSVEKSGTQFSFLHEDMLSQQFIHQKL